jgi:16S rRNA (cytosine1402-N4)-methyltransferase
MKKEAGCYHVPVMLKASVGALVTNPDGTYVDVTFGGGGHSRAILGATGSKARLFGFDQDADAVANVPDDPRFTFVMSNFRYLKNWMRYYGVDSVDGILADLGVSSHHFDDARRGFSFRENGPLDMRMNRKQTLTAAGVVNTYDDKRLSDIFYLYGELKQARLLAAAIVRRRGQQPLQTVEDLAATVRPVLGRQREKKDLAKVFQALRMEVNHEMDALREMLTAAVDLLRPGGRLVVLTYHSLEDRMAKNIMRSGNVEGRVETDFYGNRLSTMRPLSNKVETATEEELQQNPRSRSAKLRVAERVIVKGEEKE